MPIFKTPNGLVYFAHVPRAGGSSVENHLRSQFGAPAFLDRGHKAREDTWTATSPQHVTSDELARLFPEGFFDHVFAVVRHPVDRLVSVFRYQQAKEGAIAPDVTFDQWIEQLSVSFDGYDNHALPQAAFVPKKARFFRLEEGLARVARYAQKRLGAETAGGMARLNRSPAEAAEVQISPETLRRIRMIYAEDFERFGYTLEDARVPARSTVVGKAFAIRVAAPSPEAGKPWGEHAFADGLAAALEGQGHTVRIDYVDGWKRRVAGEIDLVIRGHGYRKRVFAARPDAPALMWNIYPAWPDFKDGELAGFDHVWCASQTSLSDIAGATLLPQAFDSNRMSPPEAAEGTDLVLVANNYERGRMRRMAEWALDAGLDLAIWGGGWSGTPAEPFVRDTHLPNEDLAAVYGNALAVLNDHANEMGKAGFPSNRIFDALACGAPVISDTVAWLPDDIAPLVRQVTSANELGEAVSELRETFAPTRPARLAAAHAMRETHSFDARAQEIARVAAMVSEDAMEDVA